MQLTDELIKELQRAIAYAARGVLGHKATMTHEDSRGRLYNGCDYIDEITQSMLLKILIDKGGRFEKAFVLRKKGFMNLVMRSARNMTKNHIRDASYEVPCSQLDTGKSEEFEDEGNTA